MCKIKSLLSMKWKEIWKLIPVLYPICTLSDLKLPSHLKTIVCVYSTELRLSLNFDTMKGNMNYWSIKTNSLNYPFGILWCLVERNIEIFVEQQKSFPISQRYVKNFDFVRLITKYIHINKKFDTINLLIK